MSEVNLTALHKLRNSSIGFKKRTDTLSNYLWKCPEGSSTVRIVPYIHQKDMPFVRMFFHFNFTNDLRVILSPKTFGDNDPIDDWGDYLRESGDPSKIELANKEFTSVQKFYCPIIVRGRENEGIKLWPINTQVFNSLVDQTNIVGNKFSDLKEGRDINITFSKYPNYVYNVEFSSHPSQAFTDPAFIDKIKSFPDILDFYKKHSKEELKAILDTKLAYTDPSKAFVSTEMPTNQSGPAVSSNSSSFDDLVNSFDF